MISSVKIENHYCGDGFAMTRDDIIELFSKDERCHQGTMLKDDPTSLINVWDTDKLVEITVELKHGHKITCFYGEEKVYIDLSSDDYIGLGNTVIYNKISEINSIEIKWR